MNRMIRLGLVCALALLGLSACSGGGDEGNGDDKEPVCGHTLCGDVCVDTSSSDENCGGCGNACPDWLSCQDGRCCPEGGCGDCPEGTLPCGGECVDVSSDARHCGRCDNACGVLQVCSQGACTTSCGENETRCDFDCVDLNTSPIHCGSCGNTCPAGLSCVDGTCGCRPNEELCDGVCYDLSRDPRHCGACGNTCDTGLTCVDGECKLVCAPGEEICNGVCTPVRTDVNNCGACGNVCPVGADCRSGECDCPPGTVTCHAVAGDPTSEAYCVNPEIDRYHCGYCNQPCAEGMRCHGGRCLRGCTPEETECDGQCVKLHESPAHCGACGNACEPGQACVDGECTDVGALPDLWVDANILATSVDIVERDFPANHCAIEERCVGGTGRRRLLRFSTVTVNTGTADLVIGPPAENERLVWSECHRHYHFEGYAEYRLFNLDGELAAVGHKQAYCLMDTTRYDPAAPSTRPQYSCSNQGISMGWGDSYGRGLDCQWVDITGVPPGQYELEITLNEQRLFPELDYSNNTTRVTVHIPPDPNSCVPSEEICYNGLDEDCSGEPDDNCPLIEGNDRCEDAFPMPVSGVYRARVSPSTNDDVTSSCGAPGGKDVVFSFQIFEPQVVYFDTLGSDVATSLSIRQGSCGGDEIACAGQSCQTDDAQWAGILEPGDYYLVVDATGVTSDQEVVVRAIFSGCNAAGVLRSGELITSETVPGESLRNACGNLGHGPEQSWYFTTCPGTRSFTGQVCGTFDTILALARSSCHFDDYACNDDFQGVSCPAGHRGSRLENVTLDGAGLWFGVVDGFNVIDSGSYRLEATW